MGESHMTWIACVINPVEIVTRPNFWSACIQNSRLLKVGMAPERRRIPFSNESKDQTQILTGRITSNSHLAGKCLVFSRLLHTLPRSIVSPPVVAAADGFSLHPTRGQLSPAMRTVKVYQVELAALALVKGEPFAHELNGDCLAGGQVLRAIDWMPERP